VLHVPSYRFQIFQMHKTMTECIQIRKGIKRRRFHREITVFFWSSCDVMWYPTQVGAILVGNYASMAFGEAVVSFHILFLYDDTPHVIWILNALNVHNNSSHIFEMHQLPVFMEADHRKKPWSRKVTKIFLEIFLPIQKLRVALYYHPWWHPLGAHTVR